MAVDIGAILAIAQLISILLPLIIEIVKMIENEVNKAKGSGVVVSGADKKAASLAFFQQLWPTIADTGTGAKVVALTTPEQITELASKLIDGVVGLFNALGIFKHSATPDTPTA